MPPCWWRHPAPARRRACRWPCSTRRGSADAKIVMQEPRRLAARAAARRMAATLGEAVGETVGYRVRLDTKVGPRTRIEVVTDGLFLRMLQDDPSLDGIGCVIFDELHERGLETDLSFALVREAQTALRDDLRVIAMSATLDPGPVSRTPGRRARDRLGRPHVPGRHALSRPRARGPHRGQCRLDGAPRASPRRAAARWCSCPASARSAASRNAWTSAATSTWRRSTATSRPPTRTAPLPPRLPAGARSCWRPRSPKPASPSRACAS